MLAKNTVGASIDDWKRKLEELAANNVLLSTSNLIELVESNFFKGSEIHCLYKNRNGISPNLSVKIEGNELIRFSSNDELEKSLNISKIKINSPHKSNTNFQLYEAYRYEFWYKGKVDVSTIETLASALHLIYSHSLNRYNLHEDARLRREERMNTDLFSKEKSPTFSDLSLYIQQQCGLSGILIRRTGGWNVTIDRSSGSDQALMEIAKALGKSPLTGTNNKSRDLDLELKESKTSEFFNRSAKWGKALQFINNDLHLLFLPIVRASENANYGKDKDLAKEIIVLYSKTPFMEPSVRSAIEQVDYFVEYMFSTMKFAALQKLQSEITTQAELTFTRPSRGYLEAVEDFRSFLIPHLSEILATTTASSATVRLGSTIEGFLQLCAYSNNDDGVYQDDAPIEKLFLKGSVDKSVNVFTFLNHHKFPYVYLPRITANASVKTSDGFTSGIPDMPEKYKAAGLTSITLFRDEIHSEICFPLVIGGVAVGTLNLESVYYEAFNEDVAFLTAVKQSFESYLSALLSETDLRWHISHLGRYSSVHELLQYAQLGQFSEENRRLIERLFPERDPLISRIVSEKSVKMNNLKMDTKEWIKQRYRALETEEIVDFPTLKKLSNQCVPKEFYVAVFAIIRNLLQNAIEEGDRRRNHFRVDDELRYKVGFQDSLKIYSYISAYCPPETRNMLCLQPIMKNGKLRYGMYIVGVLVRLLGGSVQLDRASEGKGISVQIIIPYPKESL